MVERQFADDRLAALYDVFHPAAQRDDFAFYLPLVMAGRAVLDVGCGTGALLRLAREAGHAGRLCGLDPAAGMLNQARQRPDIEWVHGDLSTVGWEREFELVVMTGHAFQELVEDDEIRAALAAIRAALVDGGRFAFETRNPLWASPPTRATQEAVVEQARLRGDFFAFLETRDEERAWRTYTDSRGHDVRESFTQAYDHVAQVLHLTSYRRWREGNEERTKVTREALRYTFPQELTALLHHNGFSVIRQYGDWNLEPLSAASTSIIVVCRKHPVDVCDRSSPT